MRHTGQMIQRFLFGVVAPVLVLAPGAAHPVNAQEQVIGTVTVGASPQGVGVNTTTGLAYVSNTGSDTVSVINGATPAVVATILMPVNSGPTAVGVDSTRNLVYVTNLRSSSVSVIDGSTNTVGATIAVENYPAGIAVDAGSNKIFVTNSGSDTLSFIDGVTNTVTATVTLASGSGPVGVALNPSTNRLYVANTSGNTLAVIDAVTATLLTTVAMAGNPSVVAVDSATNRIYVVNSNDNKVSVLDGATNGVLAVIAVGTTPFYGIEVNPFTKRAYVTNQDSNNLSILDLVTNTVVSSLAVGATPFGASLDKVSGRLYVANRDDNTVTVISTPANQVITVASTDPNAAEAGPVPGVFTFTRSGDTTNALTVNFTVGGSATPGTDYSAIGTSVTVPAGQATATKTVTPILDALVEGNETVILALAPGAGYTVGSPGMATVTIADYTGGLLQVAPQVEFGTVVVGSSTDRRLTIANGSTTQTLVVKANSPTPNPPFSLVSGGGTVVIGPGLTHRVTLRFTPANSGGATGTLIINSTDPALPTASLQLRGKGK